METDRDDGGDWVLAFALPNLILQDAFEFGDLALVGTKDARLAAITESSPAAAALLAGFRHCPHPEFSPSAAILRKGHRLANPWQALVDARNLLAVLACCHSWVRSIGSLNRPFYRAIEHFDFYPYRPSDDGKYLICLNAETNTLTGKLGQFHGSVHPWLSTHPGLRLTFDEGLFREVREAWGRIHLRGGSERRDCNLMRALSVAYEAGRTALHLETFLHDHGKQCSLWVSAFETLAHPGPLEKVGLGQVLDLIGQRRLDGHGLNDRETLTLRRGKNRRDLSLNATQQLYRDLYNARNDFLHGNEMALDTFAPPNLGTGVRLLDTAPLVFHAALEAHAFPDLHERGPLRRNGIEEGLARAYKSEEDELRDSGEF